MDSWCMCSWARLVCEGKGRKCLCQKQIGDGMLTLVTVRCPVRAVPQLAPRGSSLLTFIDPALDALQE